MAGKATKCPKCEARIEVPKTVEEAGNWFLKTEDGTDYGPVPKAELDEWFRDGRVTADCQLLRQGADQWQWGSDVYPSLDAEPTPAPTPAPTPKPPTVAKPPVTPRPGTLTPLSSPQPAPAGLQPLAPAPDIFSEVAAQGAVLTPAPVYPGYAPASPFGAAPSASPMAAAYGVYGGGASSAYSSYGGGSYGGGSYGGSGLGIPGIAIAVAILNFIQALWCCGNGIMALVQCLPFLMNPNQPPPKEIAGNREMLAKWSPEMSTMVGGIGIVFAIFIFLFALLFLWAGVSIFLRKQSAITVNNVLGGLAVLWVLFEVLAFTQTTSPVAIVSSAFNLVYLIAVFASMNGKDVQKAMNN